MVGTTGTGDETESLGHDEEPLEASRKDSLLPHTLTDSCVTRSSSALLNRTRVMSSFSSQSGEEDGTGDWTPEIPFRNVSN